MSVRNAELHNYNRGTEAQSVLSDGMSESILQTVKGDPNPKPRDLQVQISAVGKQEKAALQLLQRRLPAPNVRRNKPYLNCSTWRLP